MSKQREREEFMKRFVVTIRVKSTDGTKPLVRTLGGDTVFVHLAEGQTAIWTIKQERGKKHG